MKATNGRTLTLAKYASFRLAVRKVNDGQLLQPHSYGRLFMQYMVDLWARIEQDRLNYFKTTEGKRKVRQVRKRRHTTLPIVFTVFRKVKNFLMICRTEKLHHTLLKPFILLTGGVQRRRPRSTTESGRQRRINRPHHIAVNLYRWATSHAAAVSGCNGCRARIWTTRSVHHIYY